MDQSSPQLHNCVHEGLGAALAGALQGVVLKHDALLLHVAGNKRWMLVDSVQAKQADAMLRSKVSLLPTFLIDSCREVF